MSDIVPFSVLFENGSYRVTRGSYHVSATTLHEALALAARYEELATLPKGEGLSAYRQTPDENRICGAIATMPFGALVHPSPSWRTSYPGVTLAMVADYLEALRDVLKPIWEATSATEEELAALRRDVAAVRRLFGVEK